jgi:hypothetical protein
MPMGTETTRAACMDGMDNDCNGYSDCEDFSCCQFDNPVLMPTDCPSRTACNPSCGAGPSVPENTTTTCTDGCSNDDGDRYDCTEASCCAIRAVAMRSCPTNTYCGRPATVVAPLCAGDTNLDMPPTATEDSMAACGDGCDNNRNGFADCEDRDCCDTGVTCAAGTYCGDFCEGARVESEDLGACDNDCDDDQDGHVDCDDFDCAGMAGCPAA